MHRGESRPGWRVLGVELDGALIERTRLVHVRLLQRVHALPAAQKTFVGFDGGGLAADGPALAVRQRSAAQQGCDLLGDLVLHREHVARVAFELFRPLVIPARHVDELHGDAQSIAGLAHAAFEQTIDPERAAHVAQIVAAAELERGGTCRDAQPLDLGERIDELLGEPFA
jgi:hypothetical protein